MDVQCTKYLVVMGLLLFLGGCVSDSEGCDSCCGEERGAGGTNCESATSCPATDTGVFFSGGEDTQDVRTRTENLFDEIDLAENPWIEPGLAIFIPEQGQIWSVLRRQTLAWNRGDIDGFMEGYWNSDQLIFTSGDKIRRGWQATLDSYKANYTKETMGTLTFSDLDIVLTADNEAVVLGRWHLGGLKSEPQGGFVLVFRKFVEGWRVIRDHTSSD